LKLCLAEKVLHRYDSELFEVLAKKYTTPRIKEVIHTIEDISTLRKVFFSKLMRKTGWGRNEIKAAFEESLYESNIKPTESTSTTEPSIPEELWQIDLNLEPT
jgi:hypothetical protein